MSCKPLQRIEKTAHTDVADIIEEKVKKNSNLDFSAERMRIEIKAARTITANGKIFIMQNHAIFMNIQFLGFEIARLLITEDSVKYINRAERKYLFISMNDLKKQYFKDLSLKFLQNLLVNGLLLPDNVKSKRLSYYMKTQGEHVMFSPDLSYGQNLKMLYSKDILLKKVNFIDNKNSLFIDADVNYNLDNNPDKISAEIVYKSDKYRIELNIGRIENKNIQIPDMRINNNYSEIIL